MKAEYSVGTKASSHRGWSQSRVCTGTTMQAVCITESPLIMYKLHARKFGGKTDEDLQYRQVNVARTQK
jgi:hypothetical protein